MRYKLIATCLVLLGGTATVVVYEVNRRPLWSVAAAERQQRGLNSVRYPDQCGRWMVTRYPSGEGRVYYDIDHCPVPDALRAEIRNRNILIDRSQSVPEMLGNVESLLEDLSEIETHNRAREQTRGVDKGVTEMYRGLVR